MLSRIIGVLKLDANTFEEIEHDQGATGQAAIVVLIVALLGGVGSALFNAVSSGEFLSAVLGFFGTLVVVLVGWVIWSGVIYLVGTNLFGGTADMGEMLRVVGFSYAPQALSIIPCIGSLIGMIWTIAALYVAVKQGLDIDGGKAIATILIGWVISFALYCCLFSFVGGAFGGLAGGVF
jgi:hypothetical protein